jgi:endonuclease-3
MNKKRIILNFLESRYGKHIDSSRMKNQEVFELLIETVLSQRTRDENSEKAARQLFSVAKTPRQIIKLPIKKLQSLIRISGPYRQKAKRIKQISKTILENYKGKVPNTREELMKLYGVGYKTSAIVLMYGFNKPVIAVDVHVEQISKRIGLVPQNAKPQEIEVKLEEIFPVDKWYLINLGLVMFGKEICKPVNPLCIKDSKYCPFSGFCKAYKTKRFDV